MTARPSRAKLRAEIELRTAVREGAFVADNGLAPEGWVQIERDDATEIFETDDDAANAVCDLAGSSRGLVMVYAPSTDAMLPALVTGGPEWSEGEWRRLDAALVSYDPTHGKHAPTWIVIVPAFVAKAAGLH